MNLQESYFSIPNPLVLFDRWLNPYRFKTTSPYRGKKISVYWTQRAERALSNRTNSLLVEMQIYFSCVVKKRVLFHEQTQPQAQSINDKLQITSRAVQSASCSPEEFAQHYPIKQEFTSNSARNMVPRLLKIDYKNKQWCGEFSF